MSVADVQDSFGLAIRGIPFQEFDFLEMGNLLIKIAVSVYQDYADGGIEDLEQVVVDKTKEIYDEMCKYDWPKINNLIENRVKEGVWTFIEWSIRELIKD